MLTNDMQMEAKCEQPEIIMEAGAESPPAPSITTGNSDEQEKTTARTANKSTGLEVAIMLPPPPVLVSLVAAANASASAGSRPPSSIAASDKDEEEVLSLQVLSARSSTPYTVQGVCCANATCGLEATTDSSNASQWKEEEPTQLVSEVKEDVIGQITEVTDDKHNNGHSDERRKYSRSDLLDIRDEMIVIRPECLESARLQRLHFRKSENGPANGSGLSRNKSYRNSNSTNDLMPAFFKRKAATSNGNNSSNSIVYDNFKYNDSNPFSNHHNDSGSSSNSNNNYRRIGSGRISNREVNWDYIPEEDPHKNNLPEFFNTKDSMVSIQPKPQRPQQKQKHELDDNSNYVKRVIGSVTGESSFRSIGSRHSMNSSGEERYNSNASSSTNNRSDEPEWFSCGPTSRLDTIELCGFNESDQQKIRLEMSKNKPDSNNNRHDFTTGHHHNKEKKHLAFQFDDFSTSHNSKPVHGPAVNAVNKMPSSKFMPLFNAKKRDEEGNGSSNHSSTQSLNEFFKRNDIPPGSGGGQKDKLSTTEMPSVDEIEAKWRTHHQTNDSRSKNKSSENFKNSSESFKKMLHQLNQQQQHHGASTGSTSSPPPQQHHPQTNGTNNNQQPPLNLFNNDNLSNFIKHRNLQQQLLQKQQQQAAFAQLQFNAILSRPDTQMLLLSLARGEISKHGLVIQLANPNLTQADREAISAVLTFSAAGQYHQQLAINSNQQQQQQFIANQLQNLALMHQMNKSPGPRRNANAGGGGGGGGSGAATGAGTYQANNGTGAGNSPRTYTQEELQSHANFILHNAMLKKKLEEQNMGLQKMLHLQTSLMNGNINNNNNARSGGNDSMAGTKNFHYQHQQQQQQPQQNNQQQQHQRHRRGSNAGNRSNHAMGRRRSTSSSSSNTTNSAGNLASQLQHTINMQLRRQLEQRRNTIATATVGGECENVQQKLKVGQLVRYSPMMREQLRRIVFAILDLCVFNILTNTAAPTADAATSSLCSASKMSIIKFLKGYKDSGPGIMAKAIVASTVIVLGYRFLKPELESRRRRQAESYANYLYEMEQRQQQPNSNISSTINDEFQ